MKTLNELFIDELADVYDAEQQLTQAPAKTATDGELKNAFLSHLKETESHVEKLEEVFPSIDQKPEVKKCEATDGNK